MSFWNLKKSDQVALIEQDGRQYSYNELQSHISNFLPLTNNEPKKLGLVLCQNRLQDMIAYLAALQKGNAVMLVDEKAHPDLLNHVMNIYTPDWISTANPNLVKGYQKEKENLYIRNSKSESSIHEDLAVLLSTSGTTGSVKFVRLSFENIATNAMAIAEYLNLDETEKPILSLPMQYSYGLSVINSHLQVGATILLTNESVVSKDFWGIFNDQRATSFAGVPYTYQMLQRLRFEKMDLPSLRMYTQAGGRLSNTLIEYFYSAGQNRGTPFYTMYGQTEATARMSYVPPSQLQYKIGSIGIPIPNGDFSLVDGTSELRYEGPNVMLGYAYNREDLAKGDEQKGILLTGDIAKVDEEGYYSINGRIKRFIKLFGLRISLDEVEKMVEHRYQMPVACTGSDEKMYIVIEQNESLLAEIKNVVGQVYGLHHTSYKVVSIERLPRLGNGKIDYQQLKV